MAFATPARLTYHLPQLFGMDSILALPEPKAIIILGSASSVHDDVEWQRKFIAWVEPRLKAGLPTLGICYGHQLIAHLFGARVDYMLADKSKRQGLHQVTLEANPLWGNARQGELAMSHCEIVKTVPMGFRSIGRSNEVEIETLAHERFPIWSFQSHPEATAKFLRCRGMPDTDIPRLAFGNSLVDAFLAFIGK